MYRRNLLIAGFVSCFVLVVVPAQAAMFSHGQGHRDQQLRHDERGREEKPNDSWVYELNKGGKGLSFKQFDDENHSFFDLGRDSFKEKDHRFGFMKIFGHFSQRQHEHKRDDFWHQIRWFKHQQNHGGCQAPASVPLPAALPLFGLGIAGLVVLRNRRKQGR